MKDTLSQHCAEFTGLLASKAPVPGGGGAAALCGALASALCSMAGELSLGKKSTAQHTGDIEHLCAEARAASQRFLELIDADAAAFEPLSRAYAIPKDHADRARVLSEASEFACSAPLDMLRECLGVSMLLVSMDKVCSRIMLSDVGCGASLCRSAAECAAMNVYVNLPGISDAETVEEYRREADRLLAACRETAGNLAERIMNDMKEP